MSKTELLILPSVSVPSSLDPTSICNDLILAVVLVKTVECILVSFFSYTSAHLSVILIISSFNISIGIYKLPTISPLSTGTCTTLSQDTMISLLNYPNRPLTVSLLPPSLPYNLFLAQQSQ